MSLWYPTRSNATVIDELSCSNVSLGYFSSDAVTYYVYCNISSCLDIDSIDTCLANTVAMYRIERGPLALRRKASNNSRRETPNLVSASLLSIFLSALVVKK